MQEPASEEKNAVDFGSLNVGFKRRFKVVNNVVVVIFSPPRPTMTAESCILDMTTNLGVTHYQNASEIFHSPKGLCLTVQIFGLQKNSRMKKNSNPVKKHNTQAQKSRFLQVWQNLMQKTIEISPELGMN